MQWKVLIVSKHLFICVEYLNWYYSLHDIENYSSETINHFQCTHKNISEGFAANLHWKYWHHTRKILTPHTKNIDTTHDKYWHHTRKMHKNPEKHESFLRKLRMPSKWIIIRKRLETSLFLNLGEDEIIIRLVQARLHQGEY